MYLNTLKPAFGSKKPNRRLGRGIGSGTGKTAGKGHKGQHARAGGYHKVGFEGGQMPLQRRLPKFGFKSALARQTAEVRLSDLKKVKDELITLESLQKAKVVGAQILHVKVIKTGTLEKPVRLSGLRVTQGAKEAILAAGGSVEE